jgi:hypothetical protein
MPMAHNILMNFYPADFDLMINSDDDFNDLFVSIRKYQSEYTMNIASILLLPL